jgi:hypothetical protein
LLESLTGIAPSVGFVHGMINRAAGLLTGVDQRIRTLITLYRAKTRHMRKSLGFRWLSVIMG